MRLLRTETPRAASYLVHAVLCIVGGAIAAQPILYACAGLCWGEGDRTGGWVGGRIGSVALLLRALVIGKLAMRLAPLPSANLL